MSLVHPLIQKIPMESGAPAQSTEKPRKTCKDLCACTPQKLFLLAVIVAIVIYIIVDSQTTKNVQRGLEALLTWVKLCNRLA